MRVSTCVTPAILPTRVSTRATATSVFPQVVGSKSLSYTSFGNCRSNSARVSTNLSGRSHKRGRNGRPGVVSREITIWVVAATASPARFSTFTGIGFWGCDTSITAGIGTCTTNAEYPTRTVCVVLRVSPDWSVTSKATINSNVGLSARAMVRSGVAAKVRLTTPCALVSRVPLPISCGVDRRTGRHQAYLSHQFVCCWRVIR